MDLLEKHYDEIAEEKTTLRLDPDLYAYDKLQQENALHILTAREDGKLIGYFLAITHTHLHYKNVMIGQDDIYFIHPDYRGEGIGYHLIAKMIEFLEDLGCDVITIRTKINHDNSDLLEDLGMRPFEKSFIKVT